jgi:hypothetical protein
MTGAGALGDGSPLPRSSLSLPHRPLIDHNIAILARALHELDAHARAVRGV